MNIIYAIAGLVVANRDDAAAWYTRLFGRPPTFLPNDAEAVWQVAATASVYLLADAARAGTGVMSFVVDDLDACLREITGRGLEVGPVEVVPDAGRKCAILDPDGNEVTVIEIGTNTRE